MTPIYFIAFFLLAAVLVYAMKTGLQVRRLALTSAVIFGVSTLAVSLLSITHQITLPITGLWRADDFTWLIIGLIAFCYLSATMVSYRYVGVEHHEKVLSLSQVKLYFFLLPLFIISMFAAVLADDLGVLWIGLEGTTLATTMLVAMYRKDASIEAAWKYIIICSIGISLGLLGMLMFVYAGVNGAGLTPFEALSLATLRANAGLLDPTAIHWGFIFVFVGLGTKVGFVPMHTWLPDAHSKTPSPISALLSGVLLNVALYAILRFKSVADLSLGDTTWSDQIFLGFGVISIFAAAMFLLQQRNYKRMLAYSSIEHMGFMAFAIGLGPIGIAAALLHTIAHALTKSMLFFGAGEILLTYQTTKIEAVRDVMRRLPITGTLFTLGILLILAVPPSALFTSEFLAISAGLQSHPWATIIVLISLSIIALSMLHSILTMWYGGTQNSETIVKEKWNITHSVMLAQIILAVCLGLLATTSPFLDTLGSIAQSL